MIRGEPIPYVMCETYTKEKLQTLKNKLIKAGYDTTNIFKSKDGRLTLYYSKEIKFT